MKPFLAVVLTVFSWVGHLAAATPDAQAKLDAVVKALPALHWYATDGCLRETTRAKLSGNLSRVEEFVEQNKGIVDEFAKGANPPTAKVRLIDEDNPKEFWSLTLVYKNDRWMVTRCLKHLGAETMDLLKADLFMGSVGPYYDKVFDAFAAGKDYTKLFPKK